MLSTYTPAVGPQATIAYTLPLTNTAPVCQPAFRDTAATIGRGVGGFPSSGNGPAFLGPVIIDATFIIYENWCVLRGYGSGPGGVTTAVQDFNRSLIQGGLGTLVSTPPTGSKSTLNGNTLTSRTCTARVIGTPTIQKDDGGTRCTIEVQLEVPSGIWTNSDGTTDYIVDA